VRALRGGRVSTASPDVVAARRYRKVRLLWRRHGNQKRQVAYSVLTSIIEDEPYGETTKEECPTQLSLKSCLHYRLLSFHIITR